MYSRYIDIGSMYIEVLSSSRMSLPTRSGCSGRDHLTSSCGNETNADVMRWPPPSGLLRFLLQAPRQKSLRGQHLRHAHLPALESNQYSFGETRFSLPLLLGAACRNAKSYAAAN